MKASRCRRWRGIAELKVRIHFPPAESLLRTAIEAITASSSATRPAWCTFCSICCVSTARMSACAPLIESKDRLAATDSLEGQRFPRSRPPPARISLVVAPHTLEAMRRHHACKLGCGSGSARFVFRREQFHRAGGVYGLGGLRLAALGGLGHFGTCSPAIRSSQDEAREHFVDAPCQPDKPVHVLIVRERRGIAAMQISCDATDKAMMMRVACYPRRFRRDESGFGRQRP
jgi:hypothetical protein